MAKKVPKTSADLVADFKAMFETEEQRKYWRRQCSMTWDNCTGELGRMAILCHLESLESQ